MEREPGLHPTIAGLKSEGDRTPYSSPANRFLCAPDGSVALRQEILAGDISDEISSAHLIPLAAQKAASQNDWNAFIQARLRAIAAAENAFVNEILDRNPAVRSNDLYSADNLFTSEPMP